MCCEFKMISLGSEVQCQHRDRWVSLGCENRLKKLKTGGVRDESFVKGRAK
jgi:hypothetical protein